MGIHKKEEIYMKISILAGIIVSLLLLALPAAASEDYTLDIFGNANEDETINMQDVTYTELIILEYRDRTELADAKYDGKINMQDVTQIELVILGKEKELTILDDPQWSDPTRVVVTINKPVERVVVRGFAEAEVLRIIDAADKIVGVTKTITDEEVYFPELGKLSSVGVRSDLDYEAILELNPDLFLGSIKTSDIGKLSGIAVLRQRLGHQLHFPMSERIRLFGYIFDRREEAEEFIQWHDGVLDMINERTEVPDDEKLRVFYGYYQDKRFRVHIDSGGGQLLDMISAKNVGKNLPKPWTGGHPFVDTEWVIEQDPEIFIFDIWKLIDIQSYETDDTSGIAASREEILNLPELAETTAVEEGNVYILCSYPYLSYSPSYIVGISYLAKMIYPDQFEDWDPRAIHQEYLEYQGIDFDVYEHGVFVYPPLKS